LLMIFRDNIILNVQVKQQTHELSIALSQKLTVGVQDKDQMEHMSKLYTFLNMMVKRTLEYEKYNQLGRLPKFFKSQDAVAIRDFDLEMWPGYEAQSKLFTDGIFLNVDTCTKFIATTTIYEEVKGYQHQRYDRSESRTRTNNEWWFWPDTTPDLTRLTD
jgi:hypothetical protein